jgi:hypothetical protein
MGIELHHQPLTWSQLEEEYRRGAVRSAGVQMHRFCGRRACEVHAGRTRRGRKRGGRDSIKGEAGSTVLSSTEQIKHESVESSTDHLRVCSASRK